MIIGYTPSWNFYYNPVGVKTKRYAKTKYHIHPG
jgi:hypothetical protein